MLAEILHSIRCNIYLRDVAGSLRESVLWTVSSRAGEWRTEGSMEPNDRNYQAASND